MEEMAIGSSMLILLALSTLVAIILVVVAVAVKGKTGSCKQKKDMTMKDEPYYSAVVVKQEMEMKEKGVASDYEFVDDPTTDGFNPYEDVDIKQQNKPSHETTLKESSTSASVTNAPHEYAVVDMSKKRRSQKKAAADDGSSANNEDSEPEQTTLKESAAPASVTTTPPEDAVVDKSEKRRSQKKAAADNGSSANNEDSDPRQLSEGDCKC